ncbi:hypothetical protein ACTA71_006721 [Dictyostelium dimigraforme]
MKLLLAILLFILALVTPSFTQIWTSCGDSADILQIANVTMNPPEPIKGEEFTVIASGTLSETITGGNFTILVKYDSMTLMDRTFNTCTSETVVPCPIAAGEYEKEISEKIPSGAPSGKYTGLITAVSQNNTQITCVKFNFVL